jgi:hypothetical protein
MEVAANRFILEHPIVSFVLWVLLWQMLLVGSAPVVPDGPMHFTLLNWVALAFIPYTAAVTVLLPRLMRRSAREAVALRWIVAQQAWVFAWVAALTGGQQWSMGLGTLVCVLLMILALREARRTSSEEGASVPSRHDR